MDSPAVPVKPVPIGERVAALLREQGKAHAWLADAAGVERSTVSRLVSGQRSNPKPETLALLAEALGMPIEQLVAGTDAESRVSEAASLVPRAHFEKARDAMLEYERRVMDAEDRARRAEEEAAREREHRIREQAAREHAERDKVQAAKAAEHALDELRKVAKRHELEADRFKSLYVRTNADNEILKTQIAELGQAIEDSRRTARITGILAGTAAAASVLTYAATTKKND